MQIGSIGNMSSPYGVGIFHEVLDYVFVFIFRVVLDSVVVFRLVVELVDSLPVEEIYCENSPTLDKLKKDNEFK